MFDGDENEEEPMEEDVPYNDEFEQMESTTDEDEEDDDDGPKVC